MLILLVVLYGIYTFIATKTIRDGTSTPWEETSRRSFPASTQMFLVYANMGFLAGVAAVVTASRLMAASPIGLNFGLDAIGACYRQRIGLRQRRNDGGLL